MVVIALWLAGCDLGEPGTTYSTPGPVIGAGDVTGDGVTDLVTSGTDAEFAVLAGDNNGGFDATTFQHVTRCDLPSDPAWVCSDIEVELVADVNADGRDDVVISYDREYNAPDGPEPDRVFDYRLANDTGAFAEPTPVLDGPPSTPVSIAFADVTGDGDIDVVSFVDTRSGAAELVVDRIGHQVPEITSDLSHLGFRTGEIALHDMDGDGRLDVVLDGMCVAADLTTVQGCVDVLYGDDTGGFGATTTRVVAQDSNINSLVAAVSDLDNDEVPDLVAAAVHHEEFPAGTDVGAVLAFLGQGARSFGPEITSPAFVQTHGVTPADFDADGNIDLFTENVHPQEGPDDFGRIIFGQGDGRFSEVAVLPADDHSVVADLDADGRPDYAVATDDGVRVFMNRWDGRPG